MVPHSCRRLLLVAGEPSREAWRALIPAGWEVCTSGDLEYARLALQTRMCDVLVLSSDAPGAAAGEGIRRLVPAGSPPVVFLTASSAIADELALAATRSGAIWLPGEAARRCPALLEAVLVRALNEAAGEHRACTQQWQARIEKLLNMLWQSTPGTLPGPWFGPRHMLERLEEEIARTQRDGGALSVIVGEVEAAVGRALGHEQDAQLREWAASEIGRNKRRCDVSGQYGLDGFMIVLPRANPEQAQGACRRLRRVLSHPPQGLPPLRVHIGLAGVPGDRANVSGLLGRAEQRLAESRQSIHQ